MFKIFPVYDDLMTSKIFDQRVKIFTNYPSTIAYSPRSWDGKCVMTIFEAKCVDFFLGRKQISEVVATQIFFLFSPVFLGK